MRFVNVHLTMITSWSNHITYM